MAADLTSIVDASVAPYAAQFARTRSALPGGTFGWMADLRMRAMARFAEAGFPTIRDEAWKYTDLRRLARAAFSDPSADAGSALSRDGVAQWLVGGGGHAAVFVDGRFMPALSSIDRLPAGVTFRPLSQVLNDAPDLVEGHLGQHADWTGPNALVALNTALMSDGMVLVLGRNAIVEEPVQIVCLASGGAAVHPRLLVVADEGSEATLIETFAALGPATGFTNAVAEIAVGRAARIRHVRLQEESAGAWHVGALRARLADNAAYHGFVVSAGARLARTDIGIALTGKGAECTLDGATLVRARQHSDVTTNIEHLSALAQSRQMFKSVLDDQSRSVFQGRVLVAQDAQKTNAHQTNRNLLLSRGAQADSKPELIIHADDVKCSHGATVGDLDRDALFYLQARGIEERTARAMLVEAFVRELIDAVPAEAVRTRVEGTLSAWLAELTRVREAA